jgi:glutamate/tyrosine decarboxylase-like PLP-dependent enzyme
VSAQWSRRMNSLKLWLTLKVHGRQAYDELIGRQMDLARGFAQWATASETFELAAPQVLPILNLRLRTQGLGAEDLGPLHSAIVEDVNRDGQRWISQTVVNGNNVIRVMVISYLSEQRHLQELQTALEAAARKVRPAGNHKRLELNAFVKPICAYQT